MRYCSAPPRPIRRGDSSTRFPFLGDTALDVLDGIPLRLTPSHARIIAAYVQRIARARRLSRRDAEFLLSWIQASTEA